MDKPGAVSAARPGPPLWLLLELTYRCPLHCAFCYNPLEFERIGPELGTEDWQRVLREARALGAVQLGLSGGEPLARDDLEVIVAEAHGLGFYINLITSGVGLTEEQAKAAHGGALVGRATFDEIARGHIAAATSGLLKLVLDPTGRTLLGVHVVGEGASELVHIGQMALIGRLPPDAFVENVFNFPTMAEAYRVAALDAIARRP